MLKSKRLQKGDTIAVLQPSWGGSISFPHIYHAGIQALKDLGFSVKEFPSILKDEQFLYKNPKFRADDINNAFADPEVKGIIATIGGDDSVRILPYIDTNIILKNPKFFMGYSDTTMLTTFLNQKGLVTFNGPTIMAGFSQWNSFPDEYKKYIEHFLFDQYETLNLPHFDLYADGYPQWSEKENAGKLNEMKRADGWHWLQGEGKAIGKLWGGCIEVLEFMKGTEFWPERSFFDGKILFFETSEMKPTIDQVRWMLRNYVMQGDFEKASAILFGRARDYSDSEKKEFDTMIMQVLNEEFDFKNLTVVSNVDFGHTDPQIILPLGINIEIDSDVKMIKIVESPFV